MKCPNCGTENNNRNVCIKCGKFLQGKNLKSYKVDPATRRKDLKRKIFGTGKSCLLSGLLIIGAMIVITVVFVLLYQVLGRFLDLSQPIPVTDENGSVITDASGNVVFETDESGQVIFVTPAPPEAS